MSAIEPGWYPDPAEPGTQRYWDGSAWVGKPVPADEEPPERPEPLDPEPEPAPRPAAETPSPRGDAGGIVRPPEIIPKKPGMYPPKDGVELRSLGTLVGWMHRGDVKRLLDGRRLATPGARIGARVVDAVAVGLLSLVFNSYLLYLLGKDLVPAAREMERVMASGGDPFSVELPDVTGLVTAILLITVGLWFAYEVPATLNSGQTLGKRVFKIKVASLVPNQPGWGRHIVRWSYSALPLVCFPYGAIVWILDGIWCLTDRPFRQCLHDKSPATIVVSVADETRSTTAGPPSDQGSGSRDAPGASD
ncbi:RDD family protein [Salininema proteolyticum]|uniref:RDD family protein n=1 Tax=Salininema proteolyticum TaxID=1607685 RepID=A0ABV8TWZ2_9ACTN